MEKMSIEVANEILEIERRRDELMKKYSNGYDWIYLLAKASGVLEQANADRT